jgi:hypothetical protein
MSIGKEYDRVYMDGEPLDNRVAVMLMEVEEEEGIGLYVPQGSYQDPSGVSSYTHTRGGVADVFARTDRPHALTRAFRSKGFAAWHRTSEQGFDEHWHLVDIRNKRLHPEAFAQVGNYLDGGDGLWPLVAGDDPEPWRPDKIRGWSWNKYVLEARLLGRKAKVEAKMAELAKRKRVIVKELARLRHTR